MISTPDKPPVLETRGLSKHFGSLKANEAIDLVVRSGEIHAVLGENGAGKSTLMKLLYGYYQPTKGEILIDGQKADIDSPRQGRALGIGMVFQNFTLIPAFRVWENVALFLEGGASDRAGLVEKITALSRDYGLNVDPLAKVADLPMGDRQKVEIVKILAAGARVLIFDEPTSVLAPHEAQNLFLIFDRLRSEGYAVLFISHKMAEVLRCADRVTVLRKGRVAASAPREGLDRHALVKLLVGQESGGEWEEVGVRSSSTVDGTPLLEFVNVGCQTDDGRVGLEAVSFQLSPGEILGVAAVSGNGQEFLGDLVLGLRPITEGSVFLDGIDRDKPDPSQTLASGVAVLPEDPLRQGAIGGLTVKENLMLGRQKGYWKGVWTPDTAKVDEDAQKALSEAFVQSPPRLTARAADLSGGNLHRVIIAREMHHHPRLFLSYYLTRGLDLSNARAARDLVLAHAEEGMGVLFVSEDLDELFAVSDRLLVLHGGRAAGLFATADTTPEEVGLLMTGGSHHG